MLVEEDHLGGVALDLSGGLLFLGAGGKAARQQGQVNQQKPAEPGCPGVFVYRGSHIT
jgi:hypothetical protein